MTRLPLWVATFTAVLCASAVSTSAQLSQPGPSNLDAALLRPLYKESTVERLRAIRQAGERRAVELTGPLMDILDNRRESPAVREAAATALLRIDLTAALRRLRSITADPTEESRVLDGLRLVLVQVAVGRPGLAGLAVTTQLALDRGAAPAVRTEAVSALSLIAPPTYFDAFPMVVGDPSAPAVARAVAVRAFGRRAPSSQVATLLPLLDEEQPELVTAALEAVGLALTRLGEGRRLGVTLPKLRATFDRGLGREAAWRAAAIGAIGALGDPTAIAFLHDVALGDADLDVRLAAVRALGRSETSLAFRALVSVVDSKDAADAMRLPVLEQLCRLAPETGRVEELIARVRRLIAAGADFEREASVRCLSRLPGGAGTRVLWEVAEGARYPTSLRVLAVRGLADAFLETARLMKLTTVGEQPVLRAAALEALSRTPRGLTARAAIEILERSAPPEPPVVRVAVADSLRRLVVSTSELIRLYHRERHDRVRHGLLAALTTNAADPSARDLLVRVWDDRSADRESRRMAGMALARTLPRMTASTADDPVERSRIVRLLSGVTDAGESDELRTPVIDALILPQSRAPIVAMIQAELLNVIQDSRHSTRVRIAALRATGAALEQAPSLATDELVGKLLAVARRPEPEELRVAALGALTQMASEAVREELLAFAADRSEPPELRATAVANLLERNGDRPSVIAAALRIAAPQTDAEAWVFAGESRPSLIFRLRLVAADATVLSTLQRLATDRKEPDEVRAAAAAALARTQHAVGFASDPSPLVRWAGRAAS